MGAHVELCGQSPVAMPPSQVCGVQAKVGEDQLLLPPEELTVPGLWIWPHGSMQGLLLWKEGGEGSGQGQDGVISPVLRRMNGASSSQPDGSLAGVSVS